MTRTSPHFDIKKDTTGRAFMQTPLDGFFIIRHPLMNKGTAFTRDERITLGLDGLLPPHVSTLDEQLERNYRGFQGETTAIAKHRFLRAIQDRNEVLFYALLAGHLEEMLPIVYTPTVGEAVEKFHAIYQSPRGVSFSSANIGRAKEGLRDFPLDDIRMIVATDSSAILGIGDQGYGGLAISIGKLSLYTVAGGVSPYHTLPVGLDVGTNRKELMDDPLYLGERHPRLRGEDYFQFTDKFVKAVKERFPGAVIQWEDLAKDTAFTVLDRYRKEIPSFNDDIQGTGAVALAGVINACRLKGESLKDQVVVLHGAGAGGVGVALAIRQGMMREGLSEREASLRIFVLDSKGLLVEGAPMEEYKRTFAQPQSAISGWTITGKVPTLIETIANSKATVLLGLSGQPGAFSEPIVRAAAKNTARPIIFPLSNPTSSCEAHPQDVMNWTEGKALVATGSPFAPVSFGGKTESVGQGNNAFIFPGLGFGAILSDASEITDGMVMDAAIALADYTAKHFPAALYPPVEKLRDVSVQVAVRVIKRAVADGVAKAKKVNTDRLEHYVTERAWTPGYLPLKRGK